MNEKYKLLNVELSSGALALRIFEGLFLAGFVLFFFYYLPTHADSLLSPYIPQAYMPEVKQFVFYITNSSIPVFGALLAIMFFLDELLKGTWGYGVILILTGVFFLAYDYFLYRNGVLFSQNQFLGESLPLTVLYALIAVFVFSSLSSVARGVSLVAKRKRK